MARNGKSRRSSKPMNLEPSAMTLTIGGFNVGPLQPQNLYLDLSQIASLVNRRFYRQGLNWAVGGFKFLSATAVTGQLTISKLPNTWVMGNSWEKGMRAWMRLNKEALSESESVRPRFLDFKVFADHDHATVGTGANLMPTSLDGGYDAGEWEMSKFVVPDTTSPVGGVNNFEIIATGANYQGAGASGLNSVSLIEGYAASRGLPEVRDPNAPDDAADADGPTPENFLSALFNDGTTQIDNVITDMIFENNQAPYPFENDGIHLDTQYPGGANQGLGLQVHDSNIISGTTIGGATRFKGGSFPCGLVAFRQINFNEGSTLVLQIDMIPGSHRGYLAESMTEM